MAPVQTFGPGRPRAARLAADELEAARAELASLAVCWTSPTYSRALERVRLADLAARTYWAG